MTVAFKALHPMVTADHVGLIPMWLYEDNPEPASVQLHNAYGHGGGWNPFNGFTLSSTNNLMYPGDPAIKQAVAATRKHMEQQSYSLPRFRHLRKFIRGLVHNIREANELRR